MTAEIIYTFEPVKVSKDDAVIPLQLLIACDNIADSVVHGIAVLYAREHIRVAYVLKPSEHFIACHLRCKEERGKFQRLLYPHGVFGVKIRCPDISKHLVVVSQREHYNTFNSRFFQRDIPWVVYTAYMLHVLLAFYNKAIALPYGVQPRSGNVIEIDVCKLSHSFKCAAGSDICSQHSAGRFHKIHHHYGANLCIADDTDILDYLIHGLFEIIGIVELDAGLEHIGGCLHKIIRHKVYIRKLFQLDRICTVANVAVLIVHRHRKDAHPIGELLRVDIGVQRLFKYGTAVTKILKAQVLCKISLI